jgi:hypothetical protein
VVGGVPVNFFSVWSVPDRAAALMEVFPFTVVARPWFARYPILVTVSHSIILAIHCWEVLPLSAILRTFVFVIVKVRSSSSMFVMFMLRWWKLLVKESSLLSHSIKLRANPRIYLQHRPVPCTEQLKFNEVYVSSKRAQRFALAMSCIAKVTSGIESNT